MVIIMALNTGKIQITPAAIKTEVTSATSSSTILGLIEGSPKTSRYKAIDRLIAIRATAMEIAVHALKFPVVFINQSAQTAAMI